MKLVQAIACLFFLVCSISTSNASAVHDVCRSLTTGHHNHKHKHFISYEDCVKFFHIDKASITADKRGLAAIGAKIIRTTAKSVADHIVHLRASEKDREHLDCLAKCSKLYSNAMAEIGKAAKGIAPGTKGRLDQAATALGTVLDAPSKCEERFQKLHKPSPLAAEDAKFYKQVAITLFTTITL